MEKLIHTLYSGSNFKINKHMFSAQSLKFLKNIYEVLHHIEIPSYKTIKVQGNVYGEHFDLIPQDFKQFIRSHSMFRSTIQSNIENRPVTIHFMHDSKHFTNQIENVLRWLKFAYSISPQKCSRQLEVFIYLVPFKKQLPNNTKIIKQTHANNAFTFACMERNEINRFRSEEWFKVLIHETIHALGIDFSRFNYSHVVDPMLDNTYHIGIEYNFHEAYCETVANIMNVLLLTFKLPFDSFIKTFTSKMFSETIFSLYQSAKTMNYFDIDYSKIIKNKETTAYTENTPLFSYFIIKSCFLYNLDAFLKSRSKKGFVTDKNNDIIELTKFIVSNANKRNYIHDMTLLQTMINGFKHRQQDSMRFSLYG